MATHTWAVPILQYPDACELLWQAHLASQRKDKQRLAALVERLRSMGCPRGDPRNDKVVVVPKGGRITISAPRQPLPGLPR